MRYVRTTGWLSIVSITLCVSMSWAGTTGKLTGVVTDGVSGEPIPGVAISVLGTPLGTLTDIEGRYTILNVPVGTYTLKASQIGHGSAGVSGVSVSVI